MMSYDGVVFSILALEDWQREAVYDESKTDFLFWEHRIVCTCVLNTDATSAARFPPLPFVVAPKPPRQVGAPAAVKNPAPANLGKVGRQRTDLDWMIPAGKTFDDVFTEDPPNGPVVETPTFPSPLEPGAAAGLAPGLFGGALGSAGLRLKRFGPGRDKGQLDAGRRNPAMAKILPALTSTRPTVPPTDVEIRARLRRPRRQLLVWLYSGPNGATEFILVSPHPGCEVDAQNGPLVTILDVPQIHGEVTSIFRLGITTYEAPALEWTVVDPADAKLKPGADPVSVTLKRAESPNSPEAKAYEAARTAYNAAVASGKTPEDAANAAVEAARAAGAGDSAARVGQAAQAAQAAGGQPAPAAVVGALGAADVKDGGKMKKRVLATPALMSSRWSMSFGWNPDTHLRTQMISGSAAFRSDVLRARGLTADQLRGYIWHPIPEGYKRRPVGEDDVKLSANGLGIEYVIADDEVRLSFPGGVRYGAISATVVSELQYHGYDLTNPDVGAWRKMQGKKEG